YRGDPNDPLSLNLYTYCHNEPIMYFDPTGHSREPSAEDFLRQIYVAKRRWELDINRESSRIHAENARAELKNTSEYNNPDIREMIDDYLSKDYGGTMQDVLELYRGIQTNKISTSDIDKTTQPSQGMGNNILPASKSVATESALPPLELLGQAEVSATWGGGARQSVALTDLETGLTFNISWAASTCGYHTDWSPMTSEDTDIIKSILHPTGGVDWSNPDSWSWSARPGYINIDDRRIAVGFHLRPHAMNFVEGNDLPNESNTRPAGGWPVGGHMCMFYGSGGGGAAGTMNACNDAAELAYNWYAR
ncbi:hypothetical protein RBH29_15620, partial [Herbivorax sp. ANBcel31]|uniref:hypothetical protein n=1 Tax=Herbivorax sp. ANBcel31 TaxID=3069754 RepID=UPI0027B66B1A